MKKSITKKDLSLYLEKSSRELEILKKIPLIRDSVVLRNHGKHVCAKYVEMCEEISRTEEAYEGLGDFYWDFFLYGYGYSYDDWVFRNHHES